MSKYEYEWLSGVVESEKSIKPGELGHIYKHVLVPLADADKARLAARYGEEYEDCTHALIYAEIQGKCGDEEDVVVVTHVTDSEGNGPSDTAFYEDFNTPWNEVFDRYIQRVKDGVLLHD